MNGSQRGGEWPYRIELPVLGVPVDFGTDSAAALGAIRAAYEGWLSVPDAVRSSVRPGPRVGLFAADARVPGPSEPLAPDHRLPAPHRLVVASPLVHGVADTRRLAAIGYVAERLLSRPAELAEGVLDPLTLFLVGACDRQPLHAAAVARDGVAILLEGPSGTGKSTLTYAASRLGFRPLADEAVYVQVDPVLRIWGRRARIHLRPEARAHFAELADAAAVEVAPGKARVVVPPSERDPRFAERAGICLLERGSRASLERASPERVRDTVARHMSAGFDLYAASVPERARRIAERGAWVLTLSDDPAAGAALLEDVAAELARG